MRPHGRFATVTNQGKARWRSIDDALNADYLIEFLGVLIKDLGKKEPFLILDNLRAYHSKPVKTWMAEHSGNGRCARKPALFRMGPPNLADPSPKTVWVSDYQSRGSYSESGRGNDFVPQSVTPLS